MLTAGTIPLNPAPIQVLSALPFIPTENYNFSPPMPLSDSISPSLSPNFAPPPTPKHPVTLLHGQKIVSLLASTFEDLQGIIYGRCGLVPGSYLLNYTKYEGNQSIVDRLSFELYFRYSETTNVIELVTICLKNVSNTTASSNSNGNENGNGNEKSNDKGHDQGNEKSNDKGHDNTGNEGQGGNSMDTGGGQDAWWDSYFNTSSPFTVDKLLASLPSISTPTTSEVSDDDTSSVSSNGEHSEFDTESENETDNESLDENDKKEIWEDNVIEQSDEKSGEEQTDDQEVLYSVILFKLSPRLNTNLKL